MKYTICILSLFSLLLLCACSTVHGLQLNTMRAAKVEYHVLHPSVTVVNNSEVPDGSSYSRYIDENGKRYKLSYIADSVPTFFTMSLASRLSERNFFERVEALLLDSADVSGVNGVSDEMRKDWVLYDPDVVNVVVNEIKPRAMMQIETMEGFFGAEMLLMTSAQIDCFVPGQDVARFAVTDTLAWYAYGDSPQMARADLPAFELCLEEALSSLSMRVADYLTPHERVVERYIFVTGHAAMDDAYRYWSNRQYEEASCIWEYVYKNARDKGRKGKAAANLAVYYEIEDNYTEAVKYAREARSLFVEERYVSETEYISAYCKDLEQRIKEERALDALY